MPGASARRSAPGDPGNAVLASRCADVHATVGVVSGRVPGDGLGDAHLGPGRPGLVRKLVLATWPGRALRWSWSTLTRNGSRSVPHPALIGDVTDDGVLRKAGIMRATAVVAAINTDAGNVWVTLSARRCGLTVSSSPAPALRRQSPKLRRAGATRVVDPQRIGGRRIAAAALQPNVVEFLDVVMHDGSLEFRLEEVAVRAGSRLAGRPSGRRR